MSLPKNKDILNFYLSFNAYSFGGGLIGVFLNLFFFTNDSYITVLYFQIISFVIILAGYLISGYLMNRYGPKHLYVFGLALSIILFVGLFAYSSVFSNVLVFSVAYGLASGLFWSGCNLLT